MNYSWTKFVLGIIAGMIAIFMLLVTPPHFYLAMFLLFASTALMIQGRDPATEPEPPVPSELDDWREWRKTGREFVHGLPAAAVNIAVMVAFALLWDAAAKRYPLLARREIVVPTLFAVAWIPQVIAAFRRGKSRLTSTS